jgi:hypothetical protein
MKQLIGTAALAAIIVGLVSANPLYARGPRGGMGQGNGSGAATSTGSGSGSRAGFVDANADGKNDRAKDSNGDGIVNGQDPTYIHPQDGTGSMNGQGKGARAGIHPAVVAPVPTP